MSGTYDWLREQPLREPVVLAKWDGIPNIMLYEIASGALLWWMFEDHEDTSLGVFVHLTSGEAQAVHEASENRQGLLEPVRMTLKNPHAVVWSLTVDSRLKVAPFLVSPLMDEEELARLLWEAAEATTEPLEEYAEQAFNRAMAAH